MAATTNGVVIHSFGHFRCQPDDQQDPSLDDPGSAGSMHLTYQWFPTFSLLVRGSLPRPFQPECFLGDPCLDKYLEPILNLFQIFILGTCI